VTRYSDDFSDEDEPLGRPFLPGVPGGGPPGAPGQGGPGGRDPVWFAADRPEPSLAPGPGRDGRTDVAPHASTGGGEVRPYLLTGGRTQSRGTAVAMETVVIATGAAPAWGPDAARRERARILQLCALPCSAAEVAALLDLPLAVALVLVADLVAEGLLDASTVAPRQADDVVFLERLIAGVAAL